MAGQMKTGRSDTSRQAAAVSSPEAIPLSELAIGTRAVVLFFYPKDNTPVCTKEACGFRDAYEQFTAAGAEVIGVSSAIPRVALSPGRAPMMIPSAMPKTCSARLVGVNN